MGRYKVTRDKADDLFSKWIRLRDKCCKRCHSSVKINHKGLPVTHQASHFVGRRKESTRYDPLNVDTLCGACHMYFTSHPAEHYLWQVQTKGLATVEALVLAGNTYKKKDRAAEAVYWQTKLREDFGI